MRISATLNNMAARTVLGAKLGILLLMAVWGLGFPDRDISLLGIGAHRNFFFHSVLPAALVYWGFTIIRDRVRDNTAKRIVMAFLPAGLAGFASGTGVALLFDGLFQGRKAVLFPWIGSLADTTSLDDRMWLLLNGVLCLKIAQIMVRRGFSDTGKEAIRRRWRMIRSRLFGGSDTVQRVSAITVDEIESRVAAAAITGDRPESMATVRSMLDGAAEHRDKKLFNITLFGQVNVGKTALIRAVVREFGGPSTARAGETRGVTTVPWPDVAAGEFTVRFIDTPGIGESGGTAADEEALQTAAVSDLIVYVLESDIRARDATVMETLLRAGRPMIVVLNKADLYTDSQRREIVDAILNRFENRLDAGDLVTVCAEDRTVALEIRDEETGAARTETRTVPADVTPLTERIAYRIRQQGSVMHDAARQARSDRIRHAWFMAAVPEGKRRKVTALIDAQVAIAAESARKTPGTLRDVLNRFDMSAFIRSIGEMLGCSSGPGRFRFYEACVSAMERERQNGNNPEYLKLQTLEYAVARTVELTGFVAVSHFTRPAETGDSERMVSRMLREVFA